MILKEDTYISCLHGVGRRSRSDQSWVLGHGKGLLGSMGGSVAKSIPWTQTILGLVPFLHHSG